MTSTVQPGLPTGFHTQQASAESFQTFRATVCQFLEAKDYKGLDEYFHACHELYRSILVQVKSFDCILETLLEKPLNDDDCIRAFRLAGMMEKNGYSPAWSKICQAMCYLQFGNKIDGNFLVQSMIDADLTAVEDGNRFIDLFNTYKRIYSSTGNSVMFDRIDNLLNRYNEIKGQASSSTSIPFGETKV
ncbi:MAG: hypothetical protein JSR39_00765 [Verrucomicrobia bacterium]|nr:hypothetical protein [Verrucomicrobiota bacterium]